MCLAVPARIEKIEKDTALVDFGGVKKKISLGILSGVKTGDHVLVHAGFAIGKVSDEEAAATRRAFEELDEALRSEARQERPRGHVRRGSIHASQNRSAGMSPDVRLRRKHYGAP